MDRRQEELPDYPGSFRSEDHVGQVLPRGFFSRFIHALACIPLVMMFALFEVLLWRWEPAIWTETAVRLVLSEIAGTFLLAFGLGFVWCVFAPACIERWYRRYARKMYWIMILLAGTLPVILVVSEWLRLPR